jgi:hypothetical protein
MKEAITIAESSRLIELEKIVTTGLQSWIDVGEALIEIRDSRLYRIEAKTFEEYCQIKFKMSRRHANNLIAAAPVVKTLGSTLPISQRAAGELVKVEPDKRQEVFAKATEDAGGHTPTARQIKQVIDIGAREEKASFPIDTIKHTPESLKSLEEAKKDSENLSNLKWTWNRSGKKDREAFTSWIKTQ